MKAPSQNESITTKEKRSVGINPSESDKTMVQISSSNHDGPTIQKKKIEDAVKTNTEMKDATSGDLFRVDYPRSKISGETTGDNKQDADPKSEDLQRPKSMVGAISVPGISTSQNSGYSSDVSVASTSETPVVPSAFLVEEETDESCIMAASSVLRTTRPSLLVKAEKDERKAWYLNFEDTRTRLIFLSITVLVILVIGLSIGVWVLSQSDSFSPRSGKKNLRSPPP
mmetsp:Transcript_24613/g.35138  ORF Transcript_24613/g.35138 Transcript_24613/m.35138 type:complete len:227 (-) Transcript_24613:152-832(-)